MQVSFWKKPHRFVSLSLIAVTFGICAGALAQNVMWQFGSENLFTTSHVAPALTQRAFGRAGLSLMSVVGAVGGVNFEAIASAAETPISDRPALLYHPENADGHRLDIKVNDHVYHPTLSDWELIPITKFADSEYTSVVSLFGEGPDRADTFYIQFHPALKDTLLGLRVLQADMILIKPKALYPLPKRDGKTIIGTGESLPSELQTEKSKAAAESLVTELGKFDFQSWVLTDIDTQVIFKADTEFRLTASPFYYFWTTDPAELENLAKDYEKLALMKMIAKSAQDAKRFDDQMERLQEKATSIQKNQKPIPAADATEYLKQHSEELDSLNPAVFAAVRDLAGYAAFFRYAKGQNPVNWSEFVNSIGKVAPEPNIQTPTEWKRPTED